MCAGRTSNSHRRQLPLSHTGIGKGGRFAGASSRDPRWGVRGPSFRNGPKRASRRRSRTSGRNVLEVRLERLPSFKFQVKFFGWLRMRREARCERAVIWYHVLRAQMMWVRTASTSSASGGGGAVRVDPQSTMRARSGAEGWRRGWRRQRLTVE